MARGAACARIRQAHPIPSARGPSIAITLSPYVTNRVHRLVGCRVWVGCEPVTRYGDAMPPWGVGTRSPADTQSSRAGRHSLTAGAVPSGGLRLRPIARAMDMVLAAVLLIVFGPLMLALAAAVAFSSRGPVIYRQARIGHGGQVFSMPKFRTMRRETDESLPDLEALRDPAAAGPDTRVTGVGRFLRRWSLDEMPQLWTVLKGDMALVGPRPMLVDELPLLAPQHAERHVVKPGLTGLWQVSGRKDVPWDDRMDLDLAYVDAASLTTDLAIIARTVPAIVRGKGAH